MTATASELLGATVFLAEAPTATVTGVLVDEASTPVLVRVRLAATGEVVYAPGAALDSGPGGIHVRGPHVLFRHGEASFYEGRGLEWLEARGGV